MLVNTSGVASRSFGLFGLMAADGYDVGLFGKVTNDQGDILDAITRNRAASYIDSPIDFNDYYGLQYYRDFGNGTNYTEVINETIPVFGTPYQTAQIGNRTLRWLDSRNEDQPFFAA